MVKTHRKKRRRRASDPGRPGRSDRTTRRGPAIWALLGGAIIVAAALFVLLRDTDAVDDRFVTVRGSGLVLEGVPYRFAGVNYWQGAYLGAEIVKGGRARLERELDLMQDSGITNLRITAASEKSSLANAVRPAFQEGPGVYNEALLVGLDVLLDAMAARQMKAVLVMGNYWEWSGGMAQYHGWASGTPVLDPAVEGGNAFMAYAAGFYGDRKAIRLYYNYLEHVIGRVNTVNGRSYADDPTIMAWQLANEPRPHPGGRRDPAMVMDYLKWIDSAAKTVKALAPRQLVSLGNEGVMGSVGNESVYLKANAYPSIDYMTFHIWPKNWGWYAPGDPEKRLDTAVEKSLAYFDRHEGAARRLGKPTVLEEFGLGRDGEATSPDAGVTDRNAYLTAIFRAVEKSARRGGPVAGTNIWSWGGEGRAHAEDAKWVAGTDFTGDPPQEPQGLNSIFDSDIATLRLIREHAERLR